MVGETVLPVEDDPAPALESAPTVEGAEPPALESAAEVAGAEPPALESAVIVTGAEEPALESAPTVAGASSARAAIGAAMTATEAIVRMSFLYDIGVNCLVMAYYWYPSNT